MKIERFTIIPIVFSTSSHDILPPFLVWYLHISIQFSNHSHVWWFANYHSSTKPSLTTLWPPQPFSPSTYPSSSSITQILLNLLLKIHPLRPLVPGRVLRVEQLSGCFSLVGVAPHLLVQGRGSLELLAHDVIRRVWALFLDGVFLGLEHLQLIQVYLDHGFLVPALPWGELYELMINNTTIRHDLANN